METSLQFFDRQVAPGLKLEADKARARRNYKFTDADLEKLRQGLPARSSPQPTYQLSEIIDRRR